MPLDLVVAQRAATALLPVLLDATVKGTVLLMLAGLTVLAIRRRASAAAKQTIWLLTFTALLALPVFSQALPACRVLPNWAVIETPMPFEEIVAARSIFSSRSIESASTREVSKCGHTSPTSRCNLQISLFRSTSSVRSMTVRIPLGPFHISRRAVSMLL